MWQPEVTRSTANRFHLAYQVLLIGNSCAECYANKSTEATSGYCRKECDDGLAMSAMDMEVGRCGSHATYSTSLH